MSSTGEVPLAPRNESRRQQKSILDEVSEVADTGCWLGSERKQRKECCDALLRVACALFRDELVLRLGVQYMDGLDLTGREYEKKT